VLVKMREQETNCRRFDNTPGTRKHRATELLSERHGLSALFCPGFLARSQLIFTQKACPRARKNRSESLLTAFSRLAYDPDSETTRLTLFDPPQPDRIDGGKGENILVGRRNQASLPSDEDAGDLCREGERRAHDGRKRLQKNRAGDCPPNWPILRGRSTTPPSRRHKAVHGETPYEHCSYHT